MSLQVVVFIVLGFAWTVTLGWPLVSRFRSPSASAERGELDESEMIRPAEALGERLFQGALATGRILRRPWDSWIAQPLMRRRLQVLLGFCLAPFLALFLAIAFGGVFVQLVMITIGMLAGFVTYASLVGRQELQQQQNEARTRFAEAGYSSDEVERLGGGGIGLFDAGFFEPIPELVSRESEMAPAVESAPSVPAAPAFSPPPWSRPASRTKPKGRPIYIEAEVEEPASSSRRAANE